MRKTFLAGLALCLAGAACGPTQPSADTTSPSPSPIVELSPSPAAPVAPVQLTGAVNNHGVKDLTGLGTNVAVEFEMNDFYFSPTFIKVLPGTSVTFRLKNNGTTEHTFTVDSLRIDQVVAPGAQTESSLKVAEAGDFQIAQVTVPASGIVNFYCRHHRDQGMQGAFYTQEGAGVSGTPSPEPLASSSAGTTSGVTRTKTTAKKTGSAVTPVAAGQTSPKPGDLFIPDLNIGEPQRGASSLNSPAPKVSPIKLPSPHPVVTTSPKSIKGSPAPSGAAGGQGSPGVSATTSPSPGAPGTPGKNAN